MKLQAERFAKAKSAQGSKGRVNRDSLDIFTAIKYDRKLDAAKAARKQQLTAKKLKAVSHNEAVSERINQHYCEQDKSLECIKDKIQLKIKKAAANRGHQLLLIKQTAEKLRTLKHTDTKPVSFEVELDKCSHEAPAIKQRLEEHEARKTTIQEIVEKLE